MITPDSPSLVENSLMGEHLASVEAARGWANQQRQAGKSIVTTNGCFDLLHVGHLQYLKAAREAGDVLLVALNTDASVQRLKGPTRPIVDEVSRAQLLCGLRCVDAVVLFNAPTPETILRVVQPIVHVKGAQYTEDTLPEAPLLRELGTRMVFAPMVDGFSTTTLIERVLATSATER